MLLPRDFISTIADNFYDKSVQILGKTETNDNGWVKEVPGAAISTFKGNVQFNRLADIQAELGLTDAIDVSITCLPDTNVKRGDLIQYDGVTYKVSAAVPNDSHLKLAGSKWA